MEIVDLPIDIDHVDKIFHISDVHIRNLKRHKEYKEIFEKLYNNIDGDKTENSLIAILGDIAHAKTEMSPELISMISNFLNRMSQLAPTIVIPGNHDSNLNNSHRLDALTPIVDAINNENVHYLRNTGLFRVGNVVFSHMSIFSNVEDYIFAKDIPDEYIKVALYHGTVDRSVTDFGYVLTNSNVTQHTFVGYDIALLGDIHKKQNVSTYNIEEMIVDESDLDSYLQSGWELVGEIDGDHKENTFSLELVEEESSSKFW